jgi:hypothetical protein
MDDQPTAAGFGRPAPNALDRILACQAALGVGTNPRLDAAAAGGIVKKENVFDYVSPADPHPTKCAPEVVRGAPLNTYEMPDHGLFVADLINQMAPRATIKVYRVLDLYGVGDPLP